VNFAAPPDGIVGIRHFIAFIIHVAVVPAVSADFVSAIVEIVVKNFSPETHVKPRLILVAVV
jgi:hypothetical protein